MNALTSPLKPGNRPDMRIAMIRTMLVLLVLATLSACGAMPLGQSYRDKVLDAAINTYRHRGC